MTGHLNITSTLVFIDDKFKYSFLSTTSPQIPACFTSNWFTIGLGGTSFKIIASSKKTMSIRYSKNKKRINQLLNDLSVNASVFMGDTLALLQNLPNEPLFDLVVTSPPYCRYVRPYGTVYAK